MFYDKYAVERLLISIYYTLMVFRDVIQDILQITLGFAFMTHVKARISNAMKCSSFVDMLGTYGVKDKQKVLVTITFNHQHVLLLAKDVYD